VTARDWAIALGVGLSGATAVGYLARSRLRHSARAVVLRFRTRLARYHLQQRRRVKETLLEDPVVGAAVQQHARECGVPEGQVWRLVTGYIDEIVPHLNVLT